MGGFVFYFSLSTISSRETGVGTGKKVGDQICFLSQDVRFASFYHNDLYESGYRRTWARGGMMSDFRGNACTTRIWAFQRSLYYIQLEYRPFLRTHNNTRSVLNLQTSDSEAKAPKNQSKSVGQGHQFGPSFQLPGRISPSSGNIFDQDLFLSCFSSLSLSVYQL